MDFSNVNLIVSEVDGIITEGLTAFGELNIPMSKAFFVKDFEAINEIKKHWKFVFLSSDAAINMSMCKKRSVPFFFAERSKAEVFGHILRKYSLTSDQVLYVGSSYSDVECMRQSGVSICAEDSPAVVRQTADVVLPHYGGTGILCTVYDMLYADLLERQRLE